MPHGAAIDLESHVHAPTGEEDQQGEQHAQGPGQGEAALGHLRIPVDGVEVHGHGQQERGLGQVRARVVVHRLRGDGVRRCRHAQLEGAGAQFGGHGVLDQGAHLLHHASTASAIKGPREEHLTS